MRKFPSLLYIKELYDKGELGKIQYLAASHPQDMDGWPEYWERMIPMHYATHVVSPCLGMVGGLAEYVSCFGSGIQRWSKKFVLGCVKSPPRLEAELRNLGHTFLSNSVVLGQFFKFGNCESQFLKRN